MSACKCNANEIKDYSARVVKNKKLADRVFWMTLEAPELAANAEPGLSVMVYPSETDPMLGRPFAIADADAGYGEISVCYMVLGRGTEMMSRAAEGQTLRLRGFLGVPLPLPHGEGRVMLAAGGAGVGALLYAKKKLGERASIYLGVPGRGYKKMAEHITGMYPDSHIFADDGTFGDGDSMFKVIPQEPDEAAQVWCCGPEGFVKAMKAHLAQSPEKLYFMLDKRMACGYGGCMGCVIETKNGLKRVCVDQSLFRADEVDIDDN